MKNELSDGLNVAERTEALPGEGPAWDSDRDRHLLLWVDVTQGLEPRGAGGAAGGGRALIGWWDG